MDSVVPATANEDVRVVGVTDASKDAAIVSIHTIKIATTKWIDESMVSFIDSVVKYWNIRISK